MNLLEKAKSMLGKNKGVAKTGIDKAGDAIDQKTGGKFEGQVDTAQEKAKEYLDRPDDQG